MGDVCRLEPLESVKLDSVQLVVLAEQLGPKMAEETADTALEAIVTRVCAIEAAWEAGEFSRMAKSARLLVGAAEQVGLTSLVKVARDVVVLARTNDDAALAAVVKRLVRTGDASLAALWDAGQSRL